MRGTPKGSFKSRLSRTFRAWGTAVALCSDLGMATVTDVLPNYGSSYHASKEDSQTK
jgi:hypothetical protein